MSNVSKVLVDVEGGNNMLYLPLDKIISQAPAAAGDVREVDMVGKVANEVIERLRQEQARARRSEGR